MSEVGGYNQMRSDIVTFTETLRALNLPLPVNAPFRLHFALVEEFLQDHASSPDEAVKKWAQRDFHAWYVAMLAVGTLCEAVSALADLPQEELRKHLALVLAHDISQDFAPTPSKDFLYELQVAAWFKTAGFSVRLAEPDVRVSGNGIESEFGIACKHPSSTETINKHISKGYRQIAGQHISGIVAVALDLIVCAGMKKFIEFPGGKEVSEAATTEINRRANDIVAQRNGVPGRQPLDGAMFTLRMGGHVRRPPGLTFATQFGFQCEATNPAFPSVSILAAKLTEMCHREGA